MRFCEVRVAKSLGFSVACCVTPPLRCQKKKTWQTMIYAKD